METPTKETPSKIAEPASLKEVRQKLGKTQADVAKELGIKRGLYVSQMESGIRAIPNLRIESFAKAYGLSVEQLSKLWVKKTSSKRQPEIDGNLDVLPIIKTVAECEITQLTLSEFHRLLGFTSQFQNCTPGLIKEILACGFK